MSELNLIRFRPQNDCWKVAVRSSRHPEVAARTPHPALGDFVAFQITLPFDIELQVLRRLRLQKLQAESVNGADEHLGHFGDIAQRLAGSGKIRSLSSAAVLSVNVNAMMFRGRSEPALPRVSR